MHDFMCTFSGLRVNPLNLRNEDIAIEDIAHALSLLCRGSGHLKYFYSVGQHSVNCAKEAQARNWSDTLALTCLLHDASEAYISDIIRPVKKHLANYMQIEDQILAAIFRKFGLGSLTDEDYRKMKTIDNEMLENELSILMNGYTAPSLPHLYSQPDFRLKESAAVEQEFLSLFKQLQK